MTTAGVILYNRGTKMLPRLIVTLRSLRKHWHGPVSVFIDGDQPEGFVESIVKEFNVEEIWDKDDDITTLVRKIQISQKTPYDVTVFLDADTIVLGPFTELFEWAQQCDFVVTHFAGWRSDGNIIGRRVRGFTNIVGSEMIEKAIAYGPAINTGIYAYDKRRVPASLWKQWFEIAQAGSKQGCYIPDEVACQILLPQYNFIIAPPQFNVSVRYDPGTTDQRIVHFHGRKHAGKYDACRLWAKELIECLKTNLCNINEFLDRKYGDRTLHHFLCGNRSHLDLAEEIKKVRAGITAQPVVVAPVKVAVLSEPIKPLVATNLPTFSPIKYPDTTIVTPALF